MANQTAKNNHLDPDSQSNLGIESPLPCEICCVAILRQLALALELKDGKDRPPVALAWQTRRCFLLSTEVNKGDLALLF